MTKTHRLILVDASIYIFRAYYSLPDTIQDRQGNSCNALYGYIQFLFQLIEKYDPQYIAVAFDESLTSSFRNRIYPLYKSNRVLPSDNLALQMRRCRKVTELLGLASYSSKRYEADDLLGSIAGRQFRHCNMLYVTSDKDLLQLLMPGDCMLNFAKDTLISYRSVKQHIGVSAPQVVDLLALMGDAVDNIPGATGVGRKSAILLLEKYKDIHNLYAKLHTLKNSGIRGAIGLVNKLERSREQVEMSYQLAKIVKDAPVDASLKTLQRKPVNSDALCRYLGRLQFSRSLSTRVRERLC